MLQFPLRLIVYCDASYANLSNGSSQGGYIIFISGKNGTLAPICWSSRKLRRVCRSTLSAETLAAIEAIDSSFWLQKIVNELSDFALGTTVVRTDNKSLYDNINSTKAAEEKRLRVDIAAIRESVERREINVEWIESSQQLADVLTKQGANNRNLLNVLRKSKL